MKILKLSDTAIVPTKGSVGAAGFDLYADDHAFIKPHETRMIQTGIAIAVPEGYFGAIYARSGLATKQGLRPANCVGVIDEDYRGQVMVAMHNDSDTERVINHGDRIAQLVIQPYLKTDLEVVSSLDETERGAGGFGSTGSR